MKITPIIMENNAEVFGMIKSQLPQYLTGSLIAASKILRTRIQSNIQQGKIFEFSLPPLSPQTKLLNKVMKKKYGGFISKGIRTKQDSNEKITVGLLFSSKKLSSYINGGMSNWTAANNKRLIAMAKTDKVPLLKEGKYNVPGRAIFDLVAKSSEANNLVKQRALSYISQIIGKEKARLKGKNI